MLFEYKCNIAGLRPDANVVQEDVAVGVVKSRRLATLLESSRDLRQPLLAGVSSLNLCDLRALSVQISQRVTLSTHPLCTISAFRVDMSTSFGWGSWMVCPAIVEVADPGKILSSTFSR